MSETDFLLDLFELSEGASAAGDGLKAAMLHPDEAVGEAGGMCPSPPGERRRRMVEARVPMLHPQMVQTAKLAEIGLNFAELIHELRQPMAGIFGFAQLLAEKPGHPSATEWAEEIVQQSLRMQRMIEQLRRFCRAESAMTLEWLDPREALDEAIRLLPRLPPGIRLAVDLPPALPLVHANHQALVQLFWNLLINARDAMVIDELDELIDDLRRARGEIRVEEADGAAPGLCLRVLDQGCGIPDQLRARVFTPFVTSKGERGTGLGLYICRNIASACGAALELVPARAPFSTAFELRFQKARKR